MQGRSKMAKQEKAYRENNKDKIMTYEKIIIKRKGKKITYLISKSYKK